MQFQSLEHIPMGTYQWALILISLMMKMALRPHQACWNKACQLKFNQTKLDRLGKKVVQEEDSLPMQTRSSHNKVDLKDATCLFCDKPAGSEDLHNAFYL